MIMTNGMVAWQKGFSQTHNMCEEAVSKVYKDKWGGGIRFQLRGMF